MCGRFTLSIDVSELQQAFNLLREGFDYAPRYNIAPGQNILAITPGPAGRKTSYMHWGLVPSWAREAKVGYKMINARAETVDQKPAFRSAFASRRCLIPADGFYEWQKLSKIKQPLRIVLPDRRAFAFAGIWDTWHSPQGDTIISCSIITVTASELISGIHDRMPVIFTGEQEYALWLANSAPAELKELLRPYQGDIEAYPVSTLVNSPRHDSRELIDPVDDGGLFPR